MSFLTNLKTKMKNEKFKYAVLLLVILMFGSLFFIKSNHRNEKDYLGENSTNNELMVFIQDGCLHCRHAEEFLAKNKEKSKNIEVVYYNLKDRESQVLLFKNISRLDIPQNDLGTPIFIMGNEYIIGFGDNEKSNLKQLLQGKKIRTAKSK